MPIVVQGSLGPFYIGAAPDAGTNEVQSLTFAGVDAVATAGAAKIACGGYRTTALAFNAAANAVRDALRLLPSIGALGCTVVLAAGPPRVYTVTFDGGNCAKTAMPALTIESNTMTAAGLTAVTVTVAEDTPGVTVSCKGSAKGAELVDTNAGMLYINTGTALVPVWTKVGTQA